MLHLKHDLRPVGDILVFQGNPPMLPAVQPHPLDVWLPICDTLSVNVYRASLSRKSQRYRIEKRHTNDILGRSWIHCASTFCHEGCKQTYLGRNRARRRDTMRSSVHNLRSAVSILQIAEKHHPLQTAHPPYDCTRSGRVTRCVLAPCSAHRRTCIDTAEDQQM